MLKFFLPGVTQVVFCLDLHVFMACILNICVAQLAYFLAFLSVRVFFLHFFFFFKSKTEPEICFKVLGLLQWSCAKFVLILFCKGWWHKRRRCRDRKKRKDGFQDEIARHLLMCHQIWVLRDLDRDLTSGRAVCYFVPCFPSDFFYFPRLCNFLARWNCQCQGRWTLEGTSHHIL